MATDYAFFERMLLERRTYRFDWNWETDFAKPVGVDEKLVFLSRRKERFIVRGTHVMNSTSPLGLARVNERFNITLPGDIDDFYRKWDGGFLFFRRCYTLLKVKEIIEHNEIMREVRKEPKPPVLAWHLIRFCDLGNGDYLALRLRQKPATWDAVWASPDDLDASLIADRDAKNFRSLDRSFRDWLSRVCDTDGWPERPFDDHGDPPAERID